MRALIVAHIPNLHDQSRLQALPLTAVHRTVLQSSYSRFIEAPNNDERTWVLTRVQASCRASHIEGLGHTGR